MASEQEHGGRWNGFGPEPMTSAEWQDYLRSLSDDDLADMCTGACMRKERDDAEAERDRRAADE
jgi:hypothetical protein